MLNDHPLRLLFQPSQHGRRLFFVVRSRRRRRHRLLNAKGTRPADGLSKYNKKDGN